LLESLKQAWKKGIEHGKTFTKRKRKGALDPRFGLALAGVFITAFIAFMIVAQVQPEIAQNIPTNSTLYPSYQTFNGYVGKSFSMWGLSIFVSTLGLIIGAIYAFFTGGE